MSEQYPDSYLPEIRPSPPRQITFSQPRRVFDREPGCVHEMFEHQVNEHPHSCAVFHDSQRLSYLELNTRANRLARYLRERGVAPDTLVAVCMERSLDAIVALLGILKAGGAYVPLDPAYPAERISYILSDSDCHLVIANQNAIEHVPPDAAPVVLLDAPPPEIAHFSSENLSPIATPGNLAYVIYTSGSTGKPKGVQVEHRNVVNFVHSMQKEPGIDAHDVVASVTTLCFDIAGLEIHLPLATGARIAIISREEAVDGNKLRHRIERSGITLMQATPATWRLLLQAGWQGNKNLRILCGGEAFPGDLAGELLPRCESLWNMYGPTETTIWSAIYRITEPQANIPIGMPIANTHFHVVDDNMGAVAAGHEGQLLIGGKGVARGYLNRPELTAAKFIPDPFCKDGGRLYQSGDLARFLPDGNLAFLGRMDHQVKIRGYRIELGEIEFVLAQHSSVKQCVVVAREDSPGEKRLVAYLVSRGDEKPHASKLRAFLGTKLPEYMVPSTFVLLQAMPLTPNGKVDRRALPAPSRENAALDHEYVAPRTALEKKLVQIWESTLGISPIGIRDNIFELGLDSLVAARLFALIEKTLGRDLPPGPLFRAPSVELLAKLLEQRSVSHKWTSLIPIQPQGTATPLFCAHGGAGTVLFFQTLANHLAPGRPLYAFQAQGLYGQEAPHTSIQEMAAHYIAEMQTVQPHGPYLLAGWCFGGLVVFEMAQQLRRMGETVDMLAMFNAPSAPEYDLRVPSTDLGPVRERLSARWREFKQLSSIPKVKYAGRKIAGQISWRSRLVHNRIAKLVYRNITLPLRHRIYAYYGQRRRPLPEYIRDKYFLYSNSRLERHYQHRPYPGRIVIFRDQLPYPDSSLGWRRFARDVEVHEIPVPVKHHRALLQEPAVGLLAAKIEEYLSRRTKFHASVGDAA